MNTTMHPHEALIRRYFDACNAADYDALMSCFTPDAVHYFPPGLPEIPWRSADTISKNGSGASKISARNGPSRKC